MLGNANGHDVDVNLRTQKSLGFGLGLLCGLTTGFGIVIAAFGNHDILGGCLVVGGLLMLCALVPVLLKFRRPGDPL